MPAAERPLGVRADVHRRGIGGRLIERGLAILGSRGVPLAFLGGAPSYYPRFGFRSATQLGFRKPSLRIPDAAFMVRLLPASESWMKGTLVYRQAFRDNDCVGLRDPQAG